ncbi:hypothetical protein PAXRUDRAFT_22440 [Paxillus rubicundulus Ve08.2h10]|uniref:Uncharacterized protein n=1 Tax=Paxillus rubicundulus Ve08.2h10 TaxID=930991 RepID=A0A0D0D5F1_9AGAM|nr:hypothetical protein PAXRUDRAFT_22440 [Paxillus rubicundulus Ve08.2h10]
MLDAEGHANLLQAVEKEFPWYSDLHSLWRGILLYTPKAIVNSMPGASHGMQLLALVQPKSAPSATTALDAPTATPTASQGVPPPPSGPPSAPPSAPPSVPEPPQVIRPPIKLPSSMVGQDKGKQRADEPPRPWDDVDVDINVDVDVDIDMGGEEDLYKDDVDVDTNRYRGQKRSVSVQSRSPPPLTPFTYPNKNAMPDTNNRSAFCSGSPASSAGSRGRQSRQTPLSNMSY